MYNLATPAVCVVGIVRKGVLVGGDGEAVWQSVKLLDGQLVPFGRKSIQNGVWRDIVHRNGRLRDAGGDRGAA